MIEHLYSHKVVSGS